MSGGSILTILFIGAIVLFLIYDAIKKSGYHEAFTKLEKEYGSINIYKECAMLEIEKERRQFVQDKDALLGQMREQAMREIYADGQEKARVMRLACEAEIGSRKREAELEYSKLMREIGAARLSHESTFKAIEEFDKGFVHGRKWVAKYVAEVAAAKHDLLEYQKRRAPKTTEMHTALKKEHKALLEKYKFLEMQLASYKEYFPFLNDYEDLILDEHEDITSELSKGNDDGVDRARSYLNKDEYERLPDSEKYQLALDRYNQRSKSNWEIGRCYERYIGYLYEKMGWDVTYYGATKKLKDMGRDLICKRNNDIHIVQAKCWSKDKVIHEKHLFQLFGTTLLFELECNDARKITPVFITTTSLSDVAKQAAKRLAITVRAEPLPKSYPIIKCNISSRGDEKIYHLPFDQQYDRVKIDREGEFYAISVDEAEASGFRRAKRYLGG